MPQISDGIEETYLCDRSREKVRAMVLVNFLAARISPYKIHID